MIKRFIPSQEAVKQSRLLRWLGPRIHDPLLWQMNRNAVARGVAIGAFFGLMIPVAQIPAAVLAALALRANLWITAIATLVSNPFTYAPIYFFAYHLGSAILPPVAGDTADSAGHAATALQWISDSIHWLTGVGRPLVLGMLIMAIVAAVVGYFGSLLIWRLKVIVKRRRQRNARSALRRTADPL